MFRRSVSILLFPGILLGALGLTLLGTEIGLARGVVVFAVVTAAIIAIAVAERLIPYRVEWNEPRGDVRTDTIHMLVNQLGVGRLFEAIALGALVELSLQLTDAFGRELWPSGWPLPLQLAVVIVVTDLPRYWLHRLSHEVPLLWRFHAIHHSTERLYWLNAGRFHPLDELAHTLPVVVPLVLLGAGPEVQALYFVHSGVHGMFQHANIDVRLGPLNWIWPMAELHRWHHARHLEDAAANFGNNVALWDLVFGTWRMPAEQVHHDGVGLADRELPRHFWGQVVAPFRWDRQDAA